MLTKDLQDCLALQGVEFINPFKRENDRFIDEVLPPSFCYMRCVIPV
jgi:hypothetical protein